MGIDGLVRGVVESSGLEFVSATFGGERGRKVLRVLVDREGGVDLDTIALVSERLSRRLDLEDFSSGPYTLEVSSRGVERPLLHPRDFERRRGERVRVRTGEPLSGARTHTGVLVSADGDGIVLETDAGERRILYGDVRSARTVFDPDSGSGHGPGRSTREKGRRNT